MFLSFGYLAIAVIYFFYTNIFKANNKPQKISSLSVEFALFYIYKKSLLL